MEVDLCKFLCRLFFSCHEFWRWLQCTALAKTLLFTTSLAADNYLKKKQSFISTRRNLRGTQRIYSSHYLFPRGILLAGKNTGVSMSWLGNFVIDRGFALELLTFSSISTRAGCRNSEDWGRLKKKNPFPLPESSHKHTTAGQSDCACGLSRIWKRAKFLAGK